jgi:predicted site-specific integrase-resolvase
MDSTSPIAILAGTSPTRALYSPRETEAILGVSHATCYRLISAGRLDARKLDGKTCIIDESIRRLIASLPKVGEAA